MKTVKIDEFIRLMAMKSDAGIELSEYWRALADGKIGRWVDGRWEPARASRETEPVQRPKRAISREGL